MLKEDLFEFSKTESGNKGLDILDICYLEKSDKVLGMDVINLAE